MNEFVKRLRAAKIHIMIMGHLRKQMPAMMGKQKAQEKMLRNLGDHFSLVQREHHLPPGEPPCHQHANPPWVTAPPLTSAHNSGTIEFDVCMPDDVYKPDVDPRVNLLGWNVYGRCSCLEVPHTCC